MTDSQRVYDIPDDDEAFLLIEKAGEVSLSGVQKTIMHAIRNRHLVFVVYSSALRLIEPACVGFGDQGQLLIRGYQREGATPGGWKLLRGDKVEGLAEIKATFDVRPEFRSGDIAFAVISAELDVGEEKIE